MLAEREAANLYTDETEKVVYPPLRHIWWANPWLQYIVSAAPTSTRRTHNAVTPRARRTTAHHPIRSLLSLATGTALVAAGVLAAPLTSTAAPLDTAVTAASF